MGIQDPLQNETPKSRQNQSTDGCSAQFSGHNSPSTNEESA